MITNEKILEIYKQDTFTVGNASTIIKAIDSDIIGTDDIKAAFNEYLSDIFPNLEITKIWNWSDENFENLLSFNENLIKFKIYNKIK